MKENVGNVKEIETNCIGGWLMLPVPFIMIFTALWIFIAIASKSPSPIPVLAGIALIVLAIATFIGFFTLQPNEARVLVLFGSYKGTVRRSGFHWANPFYTKGFKWEPSPAGTNVVPISKVKVSLRLRNLAYAPEIASAMLRRQQAEAVIAARKTIVRGAVSIVEYALRELEDKRIVDMDAERKAAMVGNLLVVLCGETEGHPVINAGTLYS